MSINDYKEKQIRNKIINKIDPMIRPGKSKHQKGVIEVDGKIEARVKIPNNHKRIMKESQSQYIASALRLSYDQFNDLIDCPLTGPKYYEFLKELLKPKK